MIDFVLLAKKHGAIDWPRKNPYYSVRAWKENVFDHEVLSWDFKTKEQANAFFEEFPCNEEFPQVDLYEEFDYADGEGDWTKLRCKELTSAGVEILEQEDC